MALSSEQIESLWAAYENEAFRLLGYESFEQFCRAQYDISLSYAINVMENGRYVKEPIPLALRWAIWERDDFRCFYCKRRQFLSVDHILPESRGGTLDPGNLITACMSCNSAKGDKTYEEFREYRNRQANNLMFDALFGFFSSPLMEERMAAPNYSTDAPELVVVPFEEVERWTEDDQFES